MLLRSLTVLSLCSAALLAQDTARIDGLLDRGFTDVASGKYDPQTGTDALALSTAAQDHYRMARSLLLIATDAYNRSQTTEALDRVLHAERLMSGPGEIALQKQIKFIKGNSLRLLGRFNEALTSLQEWLQLNGQLPQPEPEGRIRRALGTLYREMSDVDNADLMYSEALRVARASGDAESEAGALLGLAATQKDRNRNQESIPLHLQALAVAERANLTRLRGEILNSLADGYSYIGQLDAASKYFQPALEIARSIGYRGLEAQVTERLGRVEMLRGHYAEAADLLTRADELEQTIPTQPDKAWTIKERLAKAERALGRQDQALTHFREAILLIEQMERSTVPSEMERALAVSVRREGFEEMVDFLVDMHRPGEALEIAERARARAFLEALNESQIDSQGELSAEQRSQEMELNRRVAANRHNAQGLSRAVNDLDAFYLELRRSNPAYAQLRRPELATLDRIQSELAGPDTALLEYMLGDNRSYAWAVTRDKIQLAVLPARKEIEALVNGYRDGMTAEATALTVRSTEREQRDRSRKLYRMLIQPLGEAVNSPGHLLIVPDGVLAYLPFESLVSSGKGEPYLLESHSTSYSESASASLALRSRFASGPGATKTLLAFADPDYGKAGQGTERGGVTWTSIPHTRDEVVGIARLYPAGDRVLRLGAEARESIVKSEDLRQYRYLHFAVHGFADEAHPERSGLVLSQDKDPDQDGILRMDEIARLRLDAELVTLSACQTAVGKLLDGEGLMTLSRTFFYAGARHVIATLWDVNDASTAELMKTLYASLKAGASPAGALREAKLRMLHGKEGLWRDPHFWSAFVAFQ